MQSGYDHHAQDYERAFPAAFRGPWERHAVGAFAEHVVRSGLPGTVVDVGCGTGHVTAELAARGLPVVGVDPSESMLAIARASHPDVRFEPGDANPESWGAALEAEAPEAPVAAVLARYSLSHVPPERVPGILASWADRLPVGGAVLVAFQAVDGGRAVVSFDHAVAPAWRWSPEVVADHLTRAGFAEVWRTVSRSDAEHRFPECHLLAVKDAAGAPPVPVSRGCSVDGC
ncbi:class I SAM-dependent methyltransferase [Kocuria tytonis]|uniref:Class I SAM-dependent methyltransferase n=1 Tax=Kocuria tytonis TaxID=2054280 RepID=A0A495A5L2_9MICC|nr:class I SAM-dependent methyltransferase [Kocuria tytonis]RKQ34954.1 class I SAM-dependent methyltransferase [Kocuria tytonis]